MCIGVSDDLVLPRRFTGTLSPLGGMRVRQLAFPAKIHPSARGPDTRDGSSTTRSAHIGPRFIPGS